MVAVVCIIECPKKCIGKIKFSISDLDNYCHQNHGICRYGSICGLSRNGNYTCICPQCSEEYSPVCGSNGITYKNQCKFRQDMCENQQSNITFSNGPCFGCENINCLFYSKCESNEYGSKCVCPKNCQKVGFFIALI